MKKTIITIIMLVVLSLTLFGCSNPLPYGNDGLDDSGANTQHVFELVDGNNQFALDLFSELNSGTNTFFSPYSISTAIAMTYEGANGNTADEIRSVFYFPEDDDSRLSSFASLYNSFNGDNDDYKLYTANALWVQEDYQLLDSYINLIDQYFAGGITNLDFIGDASKSADTINDWVEDNTNGKIKDIISSDTVSSAKLVLTNAIYFKGTWLNEFDEDKTTDMDFWTDSDTSVQVQMMRQTNDFNYFSNDEIQMLEMLYAGEDLSMLIILPSEGNDLDSVKSSLTLDNLYEWKDSMSEQEISIRIPKFTFETTYSLGNTLSDMGMSTAFTSGADFSGIDGTTNLFISSITHKAFIEVNEEGTEAAAATVISMTESVGYSETFYADEPFIFIIQDKETGSILFMGEVTNPNA